MLALLPCMGHTTSDHKLSNEFESLDYEVVHNKIYVTEEKENGMQRARWQDFFRWIVMLVTGVLTALVATGINVAIEKISLIKIRTIRQFPINKLEQEFPKFLLTWVGINAALVALAAIMVAYVAPVAAGSGIPQIKCYLNGVKVK